MLSDPTLAPLAPIGGRAAIHVSNAPAGEALKACARRAKALGCRIVAMTVDEGQPADLALPVMDRLARGEFDLVILRAGVDLPTGVAATGVGAEEAR